MKTLTTEQLEEKMEEGDFRLVDVLGEDHFQEEHIPGAVNIPLDRLASEAMENMDKDETVVVYCKSEDCQASPKAAEKLEKLGFADVYDYEGGLKAWKEAGHETSA